MSEVVRQDLADILERHRGWDRLAGRRIFITGGTGLFGVWLLLSLLYANDKRGLGITCTVLSRDPTNFLRQNPSLATRTEIEWVQGDVKNIPPVVGTFDYLIHLATTRAQETFAGIDQLSKLETLYLGTRNVLEFGVQHGVKKVLFTSSGITYGAVLDAPNGVSETYAGAPDTWRLDSALGEGKRVAEYLCHYYQATKGLECVIARCFSFLGPMLPLNLHYAAGNFIYDAINERDIIVKGTGQDIRSYLYLSDTVIWLLSLLTGPTQGVFNVGSSSPVRIAELAEAVQRACHPTAKVSIAQHIDHQEGNYTRAAYWPNTSKIRQALHVLEWTPLEQAVRRTYVHSINSGDGDIFQVLDR